MKYNIGDILLMKSGRKSTVTKVDVNDPGCPVQVQCEGSDYSFWADADAIDRVVYQGDTQLDRIEAKLDELRAHLGLTE